MIGGRDVAGADGQFNRATQALRQTGSLFKTFVYAAALEQGANPYDLVLDAPVTINVPGSGPWTPQNYTRDFRGQIDADRGVRQLDQHRRRAGVRERRAGAGAGDRAGPRRHGADRRRPGDRAGRLRGDASWR